MKQQTVIIRQSSGYAFPLFLVFLVLKLVGVIGWSWWWVTAPLWGPTVLVLSIFAIAALIGLFVMMVAAIVGVLM